MYKNSVCPYHSRFKSMLDTVVKKRIGKSYSDYADKNSNDIDQAKLKEYNSLFEECAHFIMLGILACKLKKPIRIFSEEGLNDATMFIKVSLIGIRDKDGEDYIDVINPTLKNTSAQKSFFHKHSTFFNAQSVLNRNLPRSRSNNQKSSRENASNHHSELTFSIDRKHSIAPKKDGDSSPVKIPQINLLLKAHTYLAGTEVSIRAITDIIALSDLVIKLRESSSDSPESKRKIYEFPNSPTCDEILRKVPCFITDRETPLTSLKNFRDTTENIKQLRELAQKSDENNHATQNNTSNSSGFNTHSASTLG